jgi:hypothetical protein
LKYICSIVAKKRRDVAMVDLPGYFLQTKAKNEGEPVILKLMGVVTLLIIESDKGR